MRKITPTEGKGEGSDRSTAEKLTEGAQHATEKRTPNARTSPSRQVESDPNLVKDFDKYREIISSITRERLKHPGVAYPPNIVTSLQPYFETPAPPSIRHRYLSKALARGGKTGIESVIDHLERKLADNEAGDEAAQYRRVERRIRFFRGLLSIHIHAKTASLNSTVLENSFRLVEETLRKFTTFLTHSRDLFNIEFHLNDQEIIGIEQTADASEALAEGVALRMQSSGDPLLKVVTHGDRKSKWEVEHAQYFKIAELCLRIFGHCDRKTILYLTAPLFPPNSHVLSPSRFRDLTWNRPLAALMARDRANGVVDLRLPLMPTRSERLNDSLSSWAWLPEARKHYLRSKFKPPKKDHTKD
ncbi:hypothetical protein SAMN04488038_10799 [Solimonas aquatica]|uniref:Uncharacterized protein n=1 Tax=Solimonas aquatica TaxID=489703 RepID=A0A1H9GJQ7_9GAMM|nr:hypothetical protein [Solimonas aquatica]SEQ50336.1 hypothetical protein SAMN04488038_10799 [Solimonas aquatica]